MIVYLWDTFHCPYISIPLVFDSCAWLIIIFLMEYLLFNVISPKKLDEWIMSKIKVRYLTSYLILLSVSCMQKSVLSIPGLTWIYILYDCKKQFHIQSSFTVAATHRIWMWSETIFCDSRKGGQEKDLKTWMHDMVGKSPLLSYQVCINLYK